MLASSFKLLKTNSMFNHNFVRTMAFVKNKTVNIQLKQASPALASIIGTEESYDTEVLQLIWKYIDANNLRVSQILHAAM